MVNMIILKKSDENGLGEQWRLLILNKIGGATFFRGYIYNDGTINSKAYYIKTRREAIRVLKKFYKLRYVKCPTYHIGEAYLCTRKN